MSLTKITDKYRFAKLLEKKASIDKAFRESIFEWYRSKGIEPSQGDIVYASCLVFMTQFAYNDSKYAFELLEYMKKYFQDHGFNEGTVEKMQDKMYLTYSLQQQAILSMLTVVDDDVQNGESNAKK